MEKDKNTYLGLPSKLNTSYTPVEERYNKMIYRRCGKSGLKLPIISLGLWQNFGDEVPFNSSKELILKSFDFGITHFDLGNNYGNPPGSSEEVLGRILKKELSKHRDELVISTKAGYDMWPGPYGEGSSKKYLIASVNQSLKRLDLDYVDIFYSHRFDSETPLEETMGALEQIIKQGKALYVGISSYGTRETANAQKILSEIGVQCFVHQPSYSLFNRWIEDEGLLTFLDKQGIGCIAFSALEQGLLTQNYLKEIPEGTRMSKESSLLKPKILTEEINQNLSSLNKIAKSRNQSLAQMSLSWILRNPLITSTLVGVRNISQLKENINALNNLNFTQKELEEIDKNSGDKNITLWPPNC